MRVRVSAPLACSFEAAVAHVGALQLLPYGAEPLVRFRPPPVPGGFAIRDNVQSNCYDYVRVAQKPEGWTWRDRRCQGRPDDELGLLPDSGSVFYRQVETPGLPVNFMHIGA